MKTRGFLKLLAGLSGITLLSGCISRISDLAKDKSQGKPYQCGRCGYLTRSETDISGDRCPRCRAKMLEQISEEEMAAALAE